MFFSSNLRSHFDMCFRLSVMGMRSLLHVKHIRLLYSFSVEFWTLYRFDDDLADGPKLVTEEKCNCVAQDCFKYIY